MGRSKEGRKPYSHLRKKVYAVMKRTEDGLLLARIDWYVGCSGWSSGAFYPFKNINIFYPFKNLDVGLKLEKGEFLVRIHSKTSPIDVNMKKT